MEKLNNDIMVVANEKDFAEIRKQLEKIGFHKLYIFPARSQKDALYEIGLIRDTGSDIELLIFDYRNPKTELETIMNLRELENGSAATIPKIVMLDPEKIQFVKNSEQFEKSEIIFIAYEDLESAIKKNVETEGAKIIERKNAKVLLVDDHKVNFFVLMEILGRLGFSRANITTADDGFEAIAILRENDINLVITDKEMPRIDGLTLLKGIKNDTGLYQIPVILNSGSATPELEEQAILFGAVGFFPKPYDIKEVEAVIEKIFPA